MARGVRSRSHGDNAMGCALSAISLAGLALASLLFRVLETAIGYTWTLVIAIAVLVVLGLFYYGRHKMRELDREERADGARRTSVSSGRRKVD